MCGSLRVCVRFRADIEVVQNEVSELETRLDKVRLKHLHTLLQHHTESLLYFQTCVVQVTVRHMPFM